MFFQCRSFFLSIITFFLLSYSAFSIEGMWPYNRLCTETLKNQFGFEASPEWIEHLMQSTVKIGGGSGSFISKDGLILTNQHVAAPSLQQISNKDHDYYTNGFFAKTGEEEKKIPLLEIKQLISISDVTNRVKASVSPSMTDAQAMVAKRLAISQIEKESFEQTGLRSEVVSLYRGEIYDLYRYKIYNDVRIVFAPESSAAYFGGEADNFSFPRQSLDMSIFRVYENGEPLKLKHFLKWSLNGASAGELIFVAGSPASTERSLTISSLKFLRDNELPFIVELLSRRIRVMKDYGSQGIEQKRQAQDLLRSYENSYKRLAGRLLGLKNKQLMENKKLLELNIRTQIQQRSSSLPVNLAWINIKNARKEFSNFAISYRLFEEQQAFNSEFFFIARNLVRLADKKLLDNPNRLPEYDDSKLEALQKRLFSSLPIYEEFEIAKLKDSLSMLKENEDKLDSSLKNLLSKILDGQSPAERAVSLVKSTKLKDLTERQRIYKEGKLAIENSQDSFILLAKLIDEDSRKLRKKYEEKVLAPENRAYPLISQAQFEIYGSNLPPDGTLTPRLSIGTVRSFIDEGKELGPFTDFSSAFEKEKFFKSEFPYCLPQSFHEAKCKMDLNTYYNFVADTDTAAGNSGSPAVNREGELVGLNFDSNQLSFPGAYLYNGDTKRSILVHSRGMLEAIKKIYHMDSLYEEILSSSSSSSTSRK